MVANINLIKQESYSVVNLEKQLMSNKSPKQTLLNQFSLCLKMEGEEQLCDCVNELKHGLSGNDSNLLIVFYVQIMPDDLVM
ncbi:hypothetical protein K9W60_14315, partial [Shigella flexneri]|nr:hypothetical protein [Shigella flexneri]